MQHKQLQMYNSDQNYHESEQNYYKESNQGSMQSGYKQNNHNIRPKNQISNVGVRNNGISGTYMRIIPKKPIHDYEKLYSENMQLRQKIKNLEDNNMKLKTRISVADKQKQHILQQFKNIENFSVLKDRRPSHTSLMKKNDKTHKFGVDENRKILYQYKDQITKLKNENARLKKTVKYTQIKQIELQNQYLQQQIKRMKAYVQDVIQNTQYDDYQRQIQKLSKQIQAQKEQVRSMHFQLKKKDEQLQDCKQKMKGIANRKVQLEKRYARDINNMRAQVHKAKQKQKDNILTSINEKKQAARIQHHSMRTVDKQKQKQRMVEKLRQQNEDQSKKLRMHEDQIKNLKRKIQELEIVKSQLEVINKNHTQKLKTEKSDNPPKLDSTVKQKTQGNQQVKNPQLKQRKKTQEKIKTQKKKTQQNLPNKNEQVLYDDSDEDLYNDELDQGDNVQMIHVDLDTKHQKVDIKQSYNQQQKQGQLDEYDAEFDVQEDQGDKRLSNKKVKVSSDEQEVLFQKQDFQKTKKKSDNKKKKSKQKQSLSKAEKILKQTMQYRLIAQRYTYDDLCRDIRDSGAQQFSLEDLVNMVTNEPFYLSQEHLEMLLFKCFGKQQLDQDDSLPSEVFLKRMKQILGTFTLNDEQKQQKILFSIHNKLQKVQSSLKKQFVKEGNKQYISKKNFMKVLKDLAKLSDQEIEQCLAQASVGSIDIAHINHQQFSQKMLST